MVSRYSSRTLSANAIHGHTAGGPLDYEQYFTALAGKDLRSLQAAIRGEVAALAAITRDTSGVYLLRIVSGVPGSAPLLYDLGTGTERLGAVGTLEMVASSAIVAVNPATRVVIVERKRPGVPIQTIERLFSTLGRELGFDALTVSITPVTSEDFLSELQTYDRVRRAEVQLIRPNFDWTDSAAQLAELGQQSNAGVMEIAATAARGETLSKVTGIVDDIKKFVAHPINALKNVKIIGQKGNATAETTLSLSGYQERRQIVMPSDADAGEREQLVANASVEYAAELLLEVED